MKKQRRTSRISSSPLLVGAVTTVIIVVGVFFSYNANKGLPFVPTYPVRVELPSASSLVVGNDVRIAGVRVKQEPDDPATAPMIVGAFTFRRAGDFDRACQALIDRDGRVNGEFYVDSLIADAVALGLDCRIFEIDHYLGWGTPNDLRTFEYWQSCFHKWASHPYRLERDRRVPAAKVAELAAHYADIPSPRPAGVMSAPAATSAQQPSHKFRWPWQRKGRG